MVVARCAITVETGIAMDNQFTNGEESTALILHCRKKVSYKRRDVA